jgi:hypothetical protein
MPKGDSAGRSRKGYGRIVVDVAIVVMALTSIVGLKRLIG